MWDFDQCRFGWFRDKTSQEVPWLKLVMLGVWFVIDCELRARQASSQTLCLQKVRSPYRYHCSLAMSHPAQHIKVRLVVVFVNVCCCSCDFFRLLWLLVVVFLVMLLSDRKTQREVCLSRFGQKLAVPKEVSFFGRVGTRKLLRNCFKF